jgi:hypothetical protein
MTSAPVRDPLADHLDPAMTSHQDTGKRGRDAKCTAVSGRALVEKEMP